MALVTEGTPAALAARIRARGKYDPAAARKEYENGLKLWQLYLDLYECDGVKLAALVEKHHAGEKAEKYERRQALAAVYNLIPTIVDMVAGYIFSEQPRYDVGDDEDLKAFLANCDGNGRELADWVHRHALPAGLVFGHLDVLVENPSHAYGRDVLSEADLDAAGAGTPHVVPVTPLKRTNWSASQTGVYNWIRVKDAGNENPDPFTADPTPPEAYLTYSRGIDPEEPAFWVRSWRMTEEQKKAERDRASLGGKDPGGEWIHEGDYAPTRRVPVATFRYKQSIDPDNRATGLSKLAMIAQLTKQIVQVLSWTTEDILANLAVYCMPSKNGEIPRDADGKERISELTQFTVLWFDREAGNPPMVLQGEVSHIEIKLKVVEMNLREILRIANLLAASGSQGAEGGTGGKSTSGRQSEIERTELHRELSETSRNLNRLVLEVLALAKSWASNEDWTAERLAEEGKVNVQHHGGPWKMDPLTDVITNTQAVVTMMAPISPTLVEEAYKQLAREFLQSDGPAMAEVLKEIDDNTGKVLKEQSDAEALLRDATSAQADAAARAAAAEADAMEGGEAGAGAAA